MSDKQTELITGRQLAHNILWNLFGSGLPLLVAIIAIPVLINGLGLARFGVLTIAWMIVGYFSLFDLGLGRALTRLVAEKLGRQQNDEIPSLIWTAMLLMAVLGFLGVVIIALISPWLVSGVLKIPSALQPETLIAFYLLAAAIPVVISSAGLRGVLEAHQRFRLVNAVRTPLGVATFLGPVFVLPFSNSLVPVVAVLVFARLIAWFAYISLCLQVEPGLRHAGRINRKLVKPLLSFGGWMTVTNIVSPFMVYMDRFLIGAVLSMAAVSFYATPYEIVMRVLIIPGALMGVMFPAFTTSFAHSKKDAAQLYWRTVKYIFLPLFPMVLIIVTFAHEGLNLWLGSDFAQHSTRVLQLLAIGVLLNGLANVPFGLVQSADRADLTAKLHIAELPFYVLVLWWLLNDYGIVGVAIAWVLRVAVDTVLLFIFANRLLSDTALLSSGRLTSGKWVAERLDSGMLLQASLVIGFATIALTLAVIIKGLVIKCLFLILVLPVFLVISWFFILTIQEKYIIRQQLRRV